MLAASYGLLLHGSGWPRVQARLHYIAVNLPRRRCSWSASRCSTASPARSTWPTSPRSCRTCPTADRGLLHAGAAILAVAFLVKAAIWPLNFWLVPAYAAASAPVAALFALMTKVGIYALLRLWTLLFSAGAGAVGAVRATRWSAAGSRRSRSARSACSRRSASAASPAFRVIVSSGTLLAAIGFAQSALTAAALFYLLGSTLATSALFLLVELVERSRQAGDAPLYRCAPTAQRSASRLARRAARTPTSTTTRRRSSAGPSRRPGLPRPELRRLRAAGRGPAAAVGLRRQVRAAVGAARAGRADRRPPLGLHGAAARLRAARDHRAGRAPASATSGRRASMPRRACASSNARRRGAAARLRRARRAPSRDALHARHRRRHCTPAAYIDAVLVGTRPSGADARPPAPGGVGRTAMKLLLPAPLLSAALFACGCC